MIEKTNENKCIPLATLLQPQWIYYEKNLDKSVFSNVFVEAYECLEKIVQENSRLEENKLEEKFRNNIYISNVISFVGRRGTGKTSTMMSFVKDLENEESEIKKKYIKKKGYDVQFCVLDTIDVSLLEENEDIFLIVLADMYQRISEEMRKKTNARGFSDIYIEFESVYKNFRGISGLSDEVVNFYSPGERLEELANSQKLRKSFQQLVGHYLQIMSAGNGLLVISLDDLDQIFWEKKERNPFLYRTLNCIYKFFSLPQVIVLAAYDQEHLLQELSITEKNKIYKKQKKLHEYRSRVGQKIEYLDKIFRPFTRVYMHSWKKQDFQNSLFDIDISVCESLNNKEGVFYEYYKENGKQTLTAKEFTLILFAKSLGIYFDCEGRKRHFIQPKSLRDIYNTVDIFTKLDDKGNKYIEKVNKEDGNWKLFYNKIKKDVYFRFAQENQLNIKEEYLYKRLNERTIGRRSRLIVKAGINDINHGLGHRNDKERFGLTTGVDEYDRFYKKKQKYLMETNQLEYSYSELIHSLYHMSRSTGSYSKEFISNILFSYSMQLNEMYNDIREKKRNLRTKCLKGESAYDILIDYSNMLNGEKDDCKFKKELDELYNAYQDYYDVIGRTIFGRWIEYIFPKVSIYNILEDKGEKNRISSITIGYVSGLKYEFQWESVKKNEIEKCIKTIVFLSLFCNNLHSFSIEIFDNMESGYKIKVHSPSIEQGIFEVTGFILPIMMYDKYLLELQMVIKNGLQVDSEDLKKEVESIIDLVFKRMIDDIHNWDMKYGNELIPICHFDLSYNLIKHLYYEYKYNNQVLNICNGKDFLRSLIVLFGRIEKHLKFFDSFYGIKNDEEKFYERFVNCPYIKMIKEENECLDNVVIGKFIMNRVIQPEFQRINLDRSPDEQNMVIY